jgi:ferrous iron transport protein B
MSCGARLAVYALFAAAFFPVGGQNIVFLLYLIGIVFAILTALLLKKTVLKGEVDDFFMELPTYHIPALKNVLINTWNKLKSFVLGAGKIIVIVVALINIVNSWGVDGSFGNQNSENSVLSATAKVVTPVFQPMGLEKDNWPATVGIISGLLAKEVVVGTLDALYSELENTTTEANTEEDFNLLQGLADAVATIPSNLADAAGNLADPLGLGAIEDVELPATAAAAQEVDVATFGAMVSRFDGKIGAFAYLLFILLYFPCMAATGAMAREVGRDWALVGVLWTTGLAYTVSVIFYQLATFSRHPMQSLSWTIGLLALLAFVVFLFAQAGKAKDSIAKQLSGEA